MREQVGSADYNAKLQVFASMVQANPSLAAEMNASTHPAKFAYEKAKAQIEYGGSDLASMEANIRKKIEAEYAEKLKGANQQVDQQVQDQDFPSNLANAPGSGNRNDYVAPHTNMESMARKKW